MAIRKKKTVTVTSDRKTKGPQIVSKEAASRQILELTREMHDTIMKKKKNNVSGRFAVGKKISSFSISGIVFERHNLTVQRCRNSQVPRVHLTWRTRKAWTLSGKASMHITSSAKIP